MPKICEGCEENDATVHCMDCGAYWCEECDATTHRLKKFQSHKRVPVTSGSPPPLTPVEPEGGDDDNSNSNSNDNSSTPIEVPLALTWAAESINCEATGCEVRKVGGRNFSFDGHAWANEQIPAGVVSGYTLRVKATMMGAVMMGVAPAKSLPGITERLYQEVGWYFYGADFKAYSGYPKMTSGRDIISGSAAYSRLNLRRGDEVTVIVDARAGSTAIMYVSVNKGPRVKVFEDIPLAEPLVPTLEFFGKNDVIEAVN